LRRFRHILPLLAFFLICATDICAQAPRRSSKRGEQHKYGTLTLREKAAPDSAELSRRDSIHRADSIHKADSVYLLGKSSINAPAFSQAKDSIVEIFADGRRIIYYYGDVSVKYEDITLTSSYMEYDMNKGEVFAKGVFDTLSKEWVGQPVMTQEGKTYNMEEVRYNFNTHKARITNMITTEDEGILHGRNIKMMEDKSINITNGRYTVCDADDPHYYLNMTMAKVITEPSQKTVFGPSYMVVEGVKIPFLGLPFGFVPKRPQRATGMLMPTFGEEEARGFYIRDIGMYFVFGDYFDLSVTGDYYTLGSWAVDINSRYKVNYKFNGELALNYYYDQTGEKGSADFFQSTNFGVKWSHTQDSKAHPGTTFSASVNFSSPTNSRYNSRSVTEALQNQISSSISYAKNWNGKFNLSVNALHSQNAKDSSYCFTLPNVTFSMSTIYPFKQKKRQGKEKIYEKISIGYNTSLQNKVNFKASEFHGMNGDFLNKFQSGMQHRFNIGLPNFSLFKYINIAPSVSYSQNWFFRKNEYVYDPDQDKPVMKEGKMFGAFGITQDFSAGLSASTRIYGTFNFGKYRKIQAIRHVISPSLSFSASPEKGTYANGYRTLHYTDASGTEKEYQYNVYSGQLFSAPSKGKSATASFSIGNNLEAKVRDYADTTGSGSKKVKLIDQLTINTNYNFLADSLKMGTVSMSMSTNLFNKVNISASAGFDPYAVDANGKRYNRFALGAGQGLLRFTNANCSISYSINGEGSIKGDDGGAVSAEGSVPAYQRVYYHPITGEYIPGGWLYYTNPNSPWSLNFSASFNCNRNYSVNKTTSRLESIYNFTTTLQVSGNIKITPKLSVNASGGFDFMAMKITTTQFSATYDLHCFNISVSWVPTGMYKSYSFRIAANASALADLLRFKKSSSYWDN